MTRYPLQSALDLRRREEEAATERLGNATRELSAAEREESRRLAAVEDARRELTRAMAHGDTEATGGGGQKGRAPDSAVATRAAALFSERRRAELDRRREALEQFRRGALSAARAAEILARKDHLTARRNREALEKHAAKHQAAARVSAERRAEETLDEVARAIRQSRLKTGR